MPLYNNLPSWNGFTIEVHPVDTWRRRIRFWPYFVGQIIQLELVVIRSKNTEKDDLQFHLVEKMPDVEKPRIIAPKRIMERCTPQESVFIIQETSKITGKGEVKYWVSNRGYNVDSEPVFTTEAISLDSWVIPILLMILGPLIGILCGFVLGLIVGS